ncbi:LPS assembly lipoprotein LptE [Pseudidiomarina marina]|uniref:LPS-assembly lipoprotein LptE n=1 Tax=Pseudidiomarina marina TaxID=502366 RepID=A0A432YKJ6_9GAMM|nr:LPS assembly lipoprotein LptE [Pseudidiomarina marina]PHR66364.1 MAG: hypothetical protein COA51_01685 [Idiomarina sp.]RUO61509.1 hypothetical protein CWI76_04470 [Pseudidiomarina marina]
MRHLILKLAILLIATALTGCGFQLRDNYQLPPAMQTISIEAPAFSEFKQVLERRLNLAGAQVGASQQNGLVIEILDDTLDRRTLSLSQSGQVAEYEMIYTVYYQLIEQGEASGRQQVDVYRDYQDDPNFALAKTREREILVQEMREEAARLLLRQTIAHLTE